jgi:uridine kinase
MDHSPMVVAAPDMDATLASLVTAIDGALADSALPLIVGIDGPDCAGKTTMSRLLLQQFMSRSRTLLIHADDYLHAQAHRERRGEFSVEAFLFDYFDQDALLRGALEVMSGIGGGSGIKPDILIVEGMFLFRPPLNAYFRFRIRMEIPEDLLLERAMKRDVGVIGDEAWVRKHYTRQCIPAQRLYRTEADPATQADILIDVHQDGRFGIRGAHIV